MPSRDTVGVIFIFFGMTCLNSHQLFWLFLLYKKVSGWCRPTACRPKLFSSHSATSETSRFSRQGLCGGISRKASKGALPATNSIIIGRLNRWGNKRNTHFWQQTMPETIFYKLVPLYVSCSALIATSSNQTLTLGE